MSKYTKRRRRRKRVKIAKRICGGAAVVVIVVSVAYIKRVQIEPCATEPTVLIVEQETGEREALIPEQTENTAARQYTDVPFVALPVSMSEADQMTVYEICQEYNVAFPLVMAIIEHESGFNRTARSQTGDSGYMQINDINAERLAELGFVDLFDLEQNVGAGVYMLTELFEKYGCGNVTFVLMAYNAGEKGAQNMIDAGIYETEYTREILERAEAFSSYIDNVLE